MNCRQCEEKISDYAAGRLDPREALLLSEHCAACQTCARALESEKSLRRLFAEAAPVLHAPDLWSQVSAQLAPRKKRLFAPRLWRMSSGFAMTAAAAVLAVTFLAKPKPNAPADPVGFAAKTPSAKLPSNPAIDGGASRVGVDESEYVYNQTRVAYQVGFALPEEGRR